jgi:glycosyltransferase involved in cell wall biosynthesis
MSDSLAPRVSVVVPALNAEDTIDEQLAALAAQTFDGQFEVIVADNGSTDATRDIAQRWAVGDNRFQLVDASARPGAGAARNAGAARARAPLFAFCDADDLAEPHWLTAMVAADDGRSLLTGPIDGVALAKRPQVDADRTRFEPKRVSGRMVAITSNTAIPATLFADVGGFDEHHPAGEDVLLSWSVLRAGYEIRFVPDAIVQRRHRETRRELWQQWATYGRASAAADRLFPEYARRFPAAAPDAGISSALRYALICLGHPVRYQSTLVSAAAFYWGRGLAKVAPGPQ